MSRPISATIITLNEEANLPGAIASARAVCAEVIVVDSGSSDRTVEVARDLGAQVHVQPYLGDGPQKRWGVRFAAHDWILSLDADERLDPEAVAAIGEVKLGAGVHDAYALRRKTFIGDRWARVWYPDPVTRLYDRRRCGYQAKAGHARVEADRVGRLAGHILHYSYAGYRDLLRKLEKFSTRGAGELRATGRRPGALAPVAHGLAAFTRKYLFKGGILYGLDGLTISVVTGFGTYMKYALLLEHQRHGAGPGSEAGGP